MALNVINIKFTKFDNTPWGFRLAGGSDFPHPLTVIRVTEESLAECMGLKVGDVVVRLNDESISALTHGEAHEALCMAGNNFVVGVQREEEFLKAAEALQGENIVPYKVSLDDLPPVYPENILLEETVIEKFEEEIVESVVASVKREGETEEESKSEVEAVPEKPVDDDSEIVPNQNLTDDEIAQLILEEEELLLPDQGVLGVNFKKLRPRVTILKESKVLEELQNLATEEPPRVQELKRTSTFLQKPQRPVPSPRPPSVVPEPEVEGYRVVIKKQQKKSVTERLLEKGLLDLNDLKTPETRSEATTPSATPDVGFRSEQERGSRPGSKAEVLEEEVKEENEEENRPESAASNISKRSQREDQQDHDQEAFSSPHKEESLIDDIERQIVDVAAKVDKQKIKELVSTEINLEKQLENVQRQLLALKQLPCEIENHLRIVSEQLHMIMELSGVQQNGNGPANRCSSSSAEEDIVEQRVKESRESRTEEAYMDVHEDYEKTMYHREEINITEETRSSSAASHEPPRVILPSAEEEEEEEEAETKELDGTISVKSADEDGSRVKKCIVSYETKLLKSRDPSPAPSHGSFEPDPNLSAKDQVIQELKQRSGRKRSRDLWPQAKQLELTLGRRWRCPNDFFNDDMIAEVLCSQAEVIRGKAMGVNFKKYEKTNLPNYDHLMNSSVYKVIHKMEREPKKGIPARPAKVNAAEDIIERARSPTLSVADDRSIRSVSH